MDFQARDKAYRFVIQTLEHWDPSRRENIRRRIPPYDP